MNTRCLFCAPGMLLAALTAAAAPGVEPARSNAPPRTVSVTNIVHAALGAKVDVSSTHKGEEGEGQPSALVDGNLVTRWSSDYAQPQEIVVDLGKPVKLATLRLHWEFASATRFRVSVSADGKQWDNLHLHFSQAAAEAKPRVDEIPMKGVSARFIRLDLIQRINAAWGFSLYEIEVSAR